MLDYIRARAEALARRASGSSSGRSSSPGSRSSAIRPGPSWTRPRRNPVLFATGPDASLNSLALKLSGIDKDFKAPTAARQDREGPRDRRADRHPPQPARATSRVSRPARKPTEPNSRTNGCSSCSRITTRSGSPASSTATPAPIGDRPLPAGCTRPAKLPVRVADLAARRHLGAARQDPRGDPHGSAADPLRKGDRGCGSSASRPISTAACSPAAPTCASRGA